MATETKVLTQASTIKCTHQGIISVQSDAKLSVMGNKVQLKTSILNGTIKAQTCKMKPPAGTTCTKVMSLVQGISTKLTVNGVAVVLDSLNGSTDGTGGSVSATVEHQKLTAV